MQMQRGPGVDGVGSREQVQLVRRAQAGDVSALGGVLARHRAAMLAVALAMLGRPAEAEDAVQEAMLIALNRIGDVRDPAAVGPWLKSVVRNCCRMQLRARTPVPMGELVGPAEAAVGTLLHAEADAGDPAELLERHAARDWVWHALERLSPPLRVVTLLRYFTGVTAYDQIAALCGVPVGTVRSRLNEARTRLARELLDSGTAAHADLAAVRAHRWREAEETLTGDRFDRVVRDTWHDDVVTTWADGRRTRGTEPMTAVMRRSLDAGVRQRVTSVVASRDILVWEADVLNPPDDPFHCPSSACWLLFLERGRVRQFRLFHPPRLLAS